MFEKNKIKFKNVNISERKSRVQVKFYFSFYIFSENKADKNSDCSLFRPEGKIY